ncbi:MAG: hypothetical protein CVV61_07670 [Tenericutes bacterium HGW-Tenericutes-6]|nr:MAG: hypothetical protein CVV61_07670 [Tenericutes bacterium HGW-Tenericutes-6]PKK96410.1 MAG: hypothetical protein CVV58_06500 [Tenericutes bacterium HGW-Tenericutes-3]
MEELIYFVSLTVFFAINLRVLSALHMENKFEKMKIWEIKAAYFLVALVMGHLLAEIMVKLSQLLSNNIG